MVYHYCDMNTFNSIITNGNLRICDITKSNDSMEILWITRYIEEIFNDVFQEEQKKTQYFGNEYDSKIYNDLLTHYIDDFFKEEQRIYSFYACCFSEEGDLLSQWRGYADDGNGVSIGFDESIISKILNSMPLVKFEKVIYSEHIQKQKIKGIAKSLIEELKKLCRNGLSQAELKEKSMKLFNVCFFKLFNLAVIMKNPFFKEEKEYRIFSLMDFNKTSMDFELYNIEYFNRKNDLVPYINFDFSNNKSIIKEIILGPKCNARTIDVENYLNSKDYLCKVRKTDGTYR